MRTNHDLNSWIGVDVDIHGSTVILGDCVEGLDFLSLHRGPLAIVELRSDPVGRQLLMTIHILPGEEARRDHHVSTDVEVLVWKGLFQRASQQQIIVVQVNEVSRMLPAQL